MARWALPAAVASLSLGAPALSIAQAPAISPPPAVEPAAAPVAAAEAPASFLVEKIAVVGVSHGSEGIVAAETLLTPGNSYTEPQLRAALQRVERLPFVVSAEFSLRRGSQRGRFELVVTVTETRPVFFGGVLGVSAWAGDGSGHWGAGFSPELGARKFFGQRSELTATVGGRGFASDGGAHGDLLFGVAYRHHGLFGSHLVGTASAGAEPNRRRFAVEVAWPASPTSVLTLGLGHTRSRLDWTALRTLEVELTNKVRVQTNGAEVGWRRDTTDDPFTPRQGGRFSARAWGSLGDSRSSSFDDPYNPRVGGWWNPGDPVEDWTSESEERSVSGSLGLRRYWSLSSKLTVGVGANAGGSWSDADGAAYREGALAYRTTARRSSFDAMAEVELLRLVSRERCGTDQCWWYAKTSLMGNGGRERWEPAREYRFPEPARSYVGSDHGTAALTTTVGVGLRGRWGSALLELTYVHQLRSRYEMR